MARNSAHPPVPTASGAASPVCLSPISPPPVPLLHHPAIGVSLVLLAASFTQVGVWLVSLRIRPQPPVGPSTVATHGLLFELLRSLVTELAGEDELNQRILHAVCQLTALGSGIAWYAAVRVALGPAWGLAVGVCWATHPAFAFLAQRPSALTLLLLGVPTVWGLLLVWERSRRPRMAVAAGLVLGLLSLVSFEGPLVLPVLALVMLAAPHAGGRRRAGTCLTVLACAAVVVPCFERWVHLRDRFDLKPRLRSDLWRGLAMDEGTRMAAAARAWQAGDRGPVRRSALRFLAAQTVREPRSTAAWFAARFLRTLYATSDGRLQRPLLVVQVGWLIPAIWGYLVALRYSPWRWLALTAGPLAAVRWILAALAEPLAGNLTPVGGFGITFGLIGVADVYERIFGRRLTRGPVPARSPAARKVPPAENPPSPVD